MKAAPNFPCNKCKGTGERFGGRCFTCKGRGGWSTSPEARAKAAKVALARRIRESQMLNRSNPALFFAVIRHADMSPLLANMRAADERGQLWTYNQRKAAQQLLDGQGLS